ncbi:Glucomannan 4-beta-mannosyltransferase 9 [Acorus calamus]|uniref:glucomannan 4-beta-mannosyltransferase n=1 Tax=Acorus calamus TaxID=4465 RepID=A0AAV9ENJ9_ACOCL|nr:Glucomannan 4-beta-mannosyltransferase 9 [Acorus calamus]
METKMAIRGVVVFVLLTIFIVSASAHENMDAQIISPSNQYLENENSLRSILISIAEFLEGSITSIKHVTSICWKQIKLGWGKANLVLEVVRVKAMIPAHKVMVMLCLAMSVILITEKLFQGTTSLAAKVFRLRPEKRFKWEAIREDVEVGNANFPMVLVQIPMYNEREVYQLSIGAACNLIWPHDRVIIQVLDDSTDPAIKELVAKECEMWAMKGKNIRYETRDNRSGYKAGALKKGMTYDYVGQCDYIAIFDADFQPESDFLTRTIPFLLYNPDVALVQARWKFVNADECLMTRLQEMSMDYHFKVEQESGSIIHSFFGFNGTAGVWRISALLEAGGWKDRTTVEDMDLAVRATLQGWKFVYVGDIKVKSELPSTFKAYRNQQHRWACGPANLFRKMAWEIIKAKAISLSKRFYLIYNFFFSRKLVAHIVTFYFYCVVIPTGVFIPEVVIPTWAVVYVPTTISILNSVGTPSSLHLIIFWVFFENVMSLHRTKAAIIGLLEVGRVNEWIVTDKLGDTLKNKNKQPSNNVVNKFRTKISERIHLLEIGLGFYLIACAWYDFNHGKNHYFIYIFPQSFAFFLLGFGYCGI